MSERLLMGNPVLSVITVVYNAAGVLDATLRSAVQQSFKNIELVIIDGGSTDDTLEIAKTYATQTGTLISEKDKGIYDAMNKGVKFAKGEWVCFLNAGDVFFDDRVLEDIFTKRNLSDVDFIYGKVQTMNEPTGVNYVNGDEVKFTDFYHSYPICHQATFSRRSNFEQLGEFDINYRLAADTEWFIRVFKDRPERTLFVDRIVAYYDVQGASYFKRMQGFREYLKFAPRHFPATVVCYNYMKYPLLWLKVKLIRIFTGTAVFAYYRKLKFNRS